MFGLWRKPFTIRRHGAQVIGDNGLTSETYEDIVFTLNVQPVAANQFEAQPAGDITVKRLKTWGADKLISAEENSGTPSDLLYYDGLWYKCTSSVKWDHTLLRHFQSDFTILPATEQMKELPPSGVSL